MPSPGEIYNKGIHIIYKNLEIQVGLKMEITIQDLHVFIQSMNVLPQHQANIHSAWREGGGPRE